MTRRHGEDGVAELIVVYPALMLLFLVGVQVAMTMHADHVLNAAAQDAATAAAQAGAPPAAAQSAAAADIAAGAPHLLHDLTITAATSRVAATVTVSARVESVVGFLQPHLTARAVAPREQFIPEPDR